jgi:hypothetical protein
MLHRFKRGGETMTRTLVAILCSTPLAGRVLAVEDCPHCVLGLYGDQAMTTTSASVLPGTPTDIYLGIQFDPEGRETGLTGIEFSISGITDGLLLAGVDFVVPTSLWVCPVPAPSDPPCFTNTDISWNSCLVGSQALMKLTLIGLGPNPDKVLQVGPRHPPSSPLWNTPVITRCDPPTYTAVRVTGGCFVVNPTGAEPPCAVGVVVAGWTGIKQLYR